MAVTAVFEHGGSEESMHVDGQFGKPVSGYVTRNIAGNLAVAWQAQSLFRGHCRFIRGAAFFT